MEHITLSSRTADTLIKTASAAIAALNGANNELQEALIHLQLAQAGIEEKDWMRHPESLERDIEEHEEATQFVFELAKELEKLAQLATTWKTKPDADLPSETRNR